MAAKTTKKTEKADKENEVKVENIVVDTPTVDENTNVVESTEVSLDPEQIKENLESVDTEIKDDDSSLEGIQKIWRKPLSHLTILLIVYLKLELIMRPSTRKSIRIQTMMPRHRNLLKMKSKRLKVSRKRLNQK